MDSDISVRQFLDYKQYYLIGVCGRTLNYNIRDSKFLDDKFGYCVKNSFFENIIPALMPSETIFPGDLPECVECLASTCSALRKKIKHGL
jgi:hypothetical protein